MNERQTTPIHAGQASTVRAAIIGMGNWGQNLVNSVQGKSDLIAFVAGATRTPARAEEFSRRHGIPMQASYQAVLADPSIDAVVLATPHTPASMSSPRSRSASPPRTRPLRSRPAPSTR